MLLGQTLGPEQTDLSGFHESQILKVFDILQKNKINIHDENGIFDSFSLFSDVRFAREHMGRMAPL